MATARQAKRRFVTKRETSNRDKFAIGDIAYVVDYTIVDPSKAKNGNYGLAKKAKDYGFKHGVKVKIVNVLQSRNTTTQGNKYVVARCDNKSNSPTTYDFTSMMLFTESQFKDLNLRIHPMYNAKNNEIVYQHHSKASKGEQLEFDFTRSNNSNEVISKEKRAVLEYITVQVDSLSKLLQSIMNSN